MRAAFAARLDLALKITGIVAALAGGVAFFARAATVVAYAQSSAARIDSLQTRVVKLETGNAALSYMACVSFAESHEPETVPSYCDQYTRAK